MEIRPNVLCHIYRKSRLHIVVPRSNLSMFLMKYDEMTTMKLYIQMQNPLREFAMNLQK